MLLNQSILVDPAIWILYNYLFNYLRLLKT